MAAGTGYNPRTLVWSLLHLAVGYVALSLGVFTAAWNVPASAGIRLAEHSSILCGRATVLLHKAI